MSGLQVHKARPSNSACRASFPTQRSAGDPNPGRAAEFRRQAAVRLRGRLGRKRENRRGILEMACMALKRSKTHLLAKKLECEHLAHAGRSILSAEASQLEVHVIPICNHKVDDIF